MKETTDRSILKLTPEIKDRKKNTTWPSAFRTGFIVAGIMTLLLAVSIYSENPLIQPTGMMNGFQTTTIQKESELRSALNFVALTQGLGAAEYSFCPSVEEAILLGKASLRSDMKVSLLVSAKPEFKPCWISTKANFIDQVAFYPKFENDQIVIEAFMANDDQNPPDTGYVFRIRPKD